MRKHLFIIIAIIAALAASINADAQSRGAGPSHASSVRSSADSPARSHSAVTNSRSHYRRGPMNARPSRSQVHRHYHSAPVHHSYHHHPHHAHHRYIHTIPSYYRIYDVYGTRYYYYDGLYYVYDPIYCLYRLVTAPALALP